MEISLKQLIEGRRKAFQNACDLIRDAEILYEHQRWARSVFISSIAIEELGKYLMIIGAIGQVLKNQVNWKRFWKRFRKHTEKSGSILAFDVLLGPFISADETLSKLQKAFQDQKHIENEKLSSLYVDFESDKFNLPMDIVDETVAHRALESAKAVLRFFNNGEKLAFSEMTIDNIDLEKFLSAESALKSSNNNANEETS